jgi:SAM-dependent methyltransferase
MDKSLLVKIFGFPATLIHGDPMVLDRWLWLRGRLPRTRNGERLIELGCGSGAFSIGAALRGYETLGLSWDARNQGVAAERAALCGAGSARFEVVDLRGLDQRTEFKGQFDVAVACEVIEHILDDRKFLCDAAASLKPGGRLLLTAPNDRYVAVHPNHMGPFPPIEDGAHVRRGYSSPMLAELCREAGLIVADVSFCSGLASQKLAQVYGRISLVQRGVGWLTALPLRPLPPLVDPFLRRTGWPGYSICLEAYKPRFSGQN